MQNGLLFISHQTPRFDTLPGIKMVLEGGCRQVQLRMKNAPSDIVGETAFKAKELCDSYDANLFIDDHVDVCLAVKATGVHLGKTDMPPAEARKILGNDFLIGGTANTFEDIYWLYRAGVDYIGLGPFRYTATKQNLSPILGMEGFERIMQQCSEHDINLPVFAIGGITQDDICQIMKTGISGIAMSSTILNAEDPVAETAKIVKLMQELR